MANILQFHFLHVDKFLKVMGPSYYRMKDFMALTVITRIKAFRNTQIKNILINVKYYDFMKHNATNRSRFDGSS